MKWLLCTLICLATLIQSDCGKLRNATRIRLKSFDSTFPQQFKRSKFKACSSILDEGQRGVCRLLAGMETQLEIVAQAPNSATSLGNSSSSCGFKRENGKSLHRYATDPSSELQSLLDRYGAMHRACVGLEQGTVKEVLSRRSVNNRSSLKCRYIVWSCTFGLGNKIMSLISTFLYAILSQRVLLLDESPSWGQLFCEPFEGSSWRLPPEATLKDDPSPAFADFYSSRSRDKLANLIVAVVFSAETKAGDHRFLVCPSAFASVKDVPVLHFRNSNQYFAAGFFLNPILRPVLETIFPEMRVFNNLAGFLLNPSDQVWRSIKSLHSKTLKNASRRIGVQLRESKGEYRDYYDSSVPGCIRANSGLCPIEIDEFMEESKRNPEKKLLASEDYFSVYVSSLVGGHLSKVNGSLREVERTTGQRFELASQDADEEQIDDVDHQKKALVDMWMLSLGDVLMTSHMSTFGYTAQGLAGITPYLLKPWPDNPCWLSVSSDPCFHFAPPKTLSCKEDGFHLGKVMVLKACPDLPDTGVQLIEL